MTGRFSAQHIQVEQNEYISFDSFHDQTCRMYDVLRSCFEIKRILAPTLKVVLQAGFDAVEEAENYLRSLRLFCPSDRVMNFLQGQEAAAGFVVCTNQERTGQSHIRAPQVSVAIVGVG